MTTSEERWRCLCFSLQREIVHILSNSKSSPSDVLKVMDWKLSNTITDAEFIDLMNSIVSNEHGIETPSIHSHSLSVRDLADKFASKTVTNLEQMIQALLLYQNTILRSLHGASSEWIRAVEDLFGFLDVCSYSYLTVHDVLYLSIISYFQSINSNFSPDEVISTMSLTRKAVSTMTVLASNTFGIVTLTQFKQALLFKKTKLEEITALRQDLSLMCESCGCGPSLPHLWKAAVNESVPGNRKEADTLKLFLVTDAPVLFFNCAGNTDAQITAELLSHLSLDQFSDVEWLEATLLKVVTSFTFLLHQFVTSLANSSTWVEHCMSSAGPSLTPKPPVQQSEKTRNVKKSEPQLTLNVERITTMANKSQWVNLPVVTENSLSVNSSRRSEDLFRTHSASPSVSDSFTSKERLRTRQSSMMAIEAASEIGLESFDPDTEISTNQLKSLLNSVPKRRSLSNSNSKRSIGVGTNGIVKEGTSSSLGKGDSTPAAPIPRSSVVKRRDDRIRSASYSSITPRLDSPLPLPRTEPPKPDQSVISQGTNYESDSSLSSISDDDLSLEGQLNLEVGPVSSQNGKNILDTLETMHSRS
ncbi:hypothetical protein P9112_008085 [Eukaryota sp. TZLM1-RC]